MPAGPPLAVVLESLQATYALSGPILVRFTLENKSSSVQPILKWATPLAGGQVDVLDIDCLGRSPEYLGILASRLPPSPDDYFLLEPGASRSVVVDLAALYSFEVPGPCVVEFNRNLVQEFSENDVRRVVPAYRMQKASFTLE